MTATGQPAPRSPAPPAADSTVSTTGVGDGAGISPGSPATGATAAEGRTEAAGTTAPAPATAGGDLTGGSGGAGPSAPVPGSRPAGSPGATTTTTTARAAGTPAPAPAGLPPGAEGWQQVAGAAGVRRALSADGDAVTVHVTPADLGPIEVRAQLARGELHVRLHAERAGTHATLDRSLPALRAELEAAGLTTGAIEAHHRAVAAPASGTAGREPARDGTPDGAGGSGATTDRQGGRQGQPGHTSPGAGSTGEPGAPGAPAASDAGSPGAAEHHPVRTSARLDVHA